VRPVPARLPGRNVRRPRQAGEFVGDRFLDMAAWCSGISRPFDGVSAAA
jgi:hypothetical protein